MQIIKNTDDTAKGKGDPERENNSEILPSFESLFCFVVNEL